MSKQIYSSVACNLDLNMLSAVYPLLAESKVEGIEWSFDALFDFRHIPSWFPELLHTYGDAGRLVGHGVFFSLFSGRMLPGQYEWLELLRKTAKEYKFDHITEHFGFMTGKDFHHGAPLNIPYTESTLRIGRDRLVRIYDACQCPVGLENLAFSYSLDEVKKHGEFLEKLVEPVNGFIILDLHNLYCQVHNFSISFEAIMQLYPLHRVREIHISGGSWEDSVIEPGRQVRRDTHDDGVPEEVFAMLGRAIEQCPNLKFVVMEQLGTALDTRERQQQFYNDFVRMQQIVSAKADSLPDHAIDSFLPGVNTLPADIAEDTALYEEQLKLSDILENAAGYDEAMKLLKASPLANSPWQIEQWQPAMLETAIHIAQKWKKKS